MHAWVGWDGPVSRQSMVSMTIIRQASTLTDLTAIRDSGADAGPQFALSSPIVVAGVRARPRSGVRIDPRPIRGSGGHFAAGGARGGTVRPGFR